jgi:hypothetical protein
VECECSRKKTISDDAQKNSGCRLSACFPDCRKPQKLKCWADRSCDSTSVGANYREAYRARSRPECEWDKRHARQRREGSGSELGGERMNLSRNAVIHCANSRRPLTGLNCSSMNRLSPHTSCRLSVKNGAAGMSDMHGNAARVAESEAGADRSARKNPHNFLNLNSSFILFLRFIILPS